MAKTLYDKIFDDHIVDRQPDGTCVLYIDRHLVHEVTSPQAFEGLRLTNRKVRAPAKTLAVVDHNVPTSDRSKPNRDPASAAQIAYFAENAALFGLEYYGEFDRVGLVGGESIVDTALDRVFIGSCANARIEDLREVARMANGRTVNANVKAMIVPGSGLVKQQAEAEGLHEIFIAAGFDWREPGCSMCLAMNPDKLAPGERCASTSSRNFEGRQGLQGTHPSGFAGHGGGGHNRRPVRRRARMGLSACPSPVAG